MTAPVPHCPTLPAAVPGNPVFLGEKAGFSLYRETTVGVDFVWPMPSPAELTALYDDPRYFGGDIVGGYRDYAAQTEPLLPQFEALLARYEEEGATKTILDVGCGGGLHLDVARRRGWRCHGVEISDHARALAAERLGPGAFLVPSLDALPPHNYDVVVMLDVIEHLPNPTETFFRLFSLGAIHEGTVLVISTPNARCHDALRDPVGWVYRHPPYHVLYYSGEGLRAMLERFKFAHIAIEGVFPSDAAPADGFPDEALPLNDTLRGAAGVMAVASGCRFSEFMHERYVPGTWSEITRYEHLPRYAFAASLATGRRVLDFGCGTGYGSASLASVAAHVTGCDIDAEALEWARSEHRADGLTFQRNEDLGASLPAGSFDLIVCFEVIEHLTADQQRTAVANFARLLAPGGRLLTSTPNPAITALYGENPYHLHELGADAFRDLLGAHFGSVRLFDQCLGSGVLFKDLDREVAVGTTLGLGDAAARESACWLALCAQEDLPASGDVLVWDWSRAFVNAAVARDQQTGADKGRIVGMGYQLAALQQTLDETRARVQDLAERAREQNERIGLLMRLAAQGAEEPPRPAGEAALLDRVAARARAERAARIWNHARRRHGLSSISATKPPAPFLALDAPKGAAPRIVHLVLARNAELALDRIAAAHATTPAALRPEIFLAPNCPPVALEGAPVSHLAHDRVDAVFHALVRRRPRLIHLHIDDADPPDWIREIPAVAELLRIPSLVTLGVDVNPGSFGPAAAVVRESAGEPADPGAESLAPGWPDAAPTAAAGGGPLVTWLSLRGNAPEHLAVIAEALAKFPALRVVALGTSETPWVTEAALRTAGLSGRVDLVGAISREEMQKLIQGAGVVVAPGEAPFLALSALRLGVPLVALGAASHVLPARRKIHDAPPAEQIRWLLDHPTEAAQNAAALWKLGRKAFERAPASARYGALYQELTARP